jgi:hypothetical protein
MTGAIRANGSAGCAAGTSQLLVVLFYVVAIVKMSGS